MDTSASLFARARPRAVLPKTEANTMIETLSPTKANRTKKTVGFLDLPGEIRNQIYKYYFRTSFRCELVGADRDFKAHTPLVVKLYSLPKPPKQHSKAQLGGSRDNQSVTVRFPRLRRYHKTHSTPPIMNRGWLNLHCALALVCKKTHVETIPLLYQQITFVFEAPHRIDGFFHRVSRQNYVNVTKLHLYYATYGNPSTARDTVWQEKHIESWTRACSAIFKRLTCLRELKVNIWINDNAPKFNLRQKWLQPLLQFRRMTCDHSREGASGAESVERKHYTLKKVFIEVKTRLFSHDFDGNIYLSNACKHLHHLFGLGISRAILGAKEDEAMAKFNQAWSEKYKIWRHHLGFARTGW